MSMRIASLLLAAAVSMGTGHVFTMHEKVDVLVNNVGPFNNIAETYPYYNLPFCEPDEHKEESHALGEALSGDRRRASKFDIRYMVGTQWQALCSMRLTADKLEKFITAIKQHYIFELFVDELPVKGFVGEVETKRITENGRIRNQSKVYLFTHLDFSIAYNPVGNSIIAVNLTTDATQRVELVAGEEMNVEFSFSTHWKSTTIAYADRMREHNSHAINDQAVEIHWLSIINSFVLVLLLTAFLAIVLLRVLKKDFSNYMEIEDEEFDNDDQDTGWKLIHGDVFRPPENVMLFSAVIGTGSQLLVLIVTVLLLALVGAFYPGNRGAVYTAATIIYCATAILAGYVGTSLYKSLGGEKWAINSLLIATVFAFPLFAIFCFLNTVAIFYGSSSALPFGTILLMILLWALVTFPLTVFGSMRGKNSKSFDAPCKTNRVERQIPPSKWYFSTPVYILIAGFLPFSAIYIELHYIFASIWGHRVYTLFGILALAFVMLVIVTVFTTVALIYFQLAAEDYKWWWSSVVSGSSTGIFIYLYAIFYFHYRTEMDGLLQSSFFFGYSFVIAYAFSLALGALGFYASKGFVKHIYLTIKVD